MDIEHAEPPFHFPAEPPFFVLPRHAGAEGPLASARGDKKIGLGATKKG